MVVQSVCALIITFWIWKDWKGIRHGIERQRTTCSLGSGLWHGGLGLGLSCVSSLTLDRI